MDHDIPLLSETKMSVSILNRVLCNRDLLHLTQDECHLLYKQRAALKATLHDAKSYTRPCSVLPASHP